MTGPFVKRRWWATTALLGVLAGLCLVVVGPPLPAHSDDEEWGALATLYATPDSIAPGGYTTLFGKGYSTAPGSSNISIRLDGRSGRIIWEFSPRYYIDHQEIRIPADVPVGQHTLNATQVLASGSAVSGTPGRASILLSGSPQPPTTPSTIDCDDEDLEQPTGPKHHIATDKNWDQKGSWGMPWTPLLKPFLDHAGLNISYAPENIVEVPGHKGPHPQAYHEALYDALYRATSGNGLSAGTPEWRQAVIDVLNEFARSAQTPGSQINYWLTHPQNYCYPG